MQNLYTHTWMPAVELLAALAVLLWSTGLPSKWWARRRVASAVAFLTPVGLGRFRLWPTVTIAGRPMLC